VFRLLQSELIAKCGAEFEEILRQRKAQGLAPRPQSKLTGIHQVIIARRAAMLRMRAGSTDHPMRWGNTTALGTSAATPIAAGMTALVKAANPSLTPSQIRTIPQQTAQDIGKSGYDALFNFGLVDATASGGCSGQSVA
jgi:subtilase family protein